MWLDIFTLIKGGYFTEKFLHSPHPGEKEEFLNILKLLELDNWSNKLSRTINKFEKEDFIGRYSDLGLNCESSKLDLFEFAVLLSYGIVKTDPFNNISKTDWILFLPDLEEFEISLLSLLLSHSLSYNLNSIPLIEKIMLLLQDPQFRENSAKYHYIIALRSTVEQVYENKEIGDIFEELTDLVVSKYEYFASWTREFSDTTKYGSYPVELIRIISQVSSDLTTKYYDYVKHNEYLHPHFKPILDIYHYKKHHPLLHKSRVKSLMNICYDLIWDPIAYSEEIILYNKIIKELEYYGRLIPALIISLLAQEIIKRKHEMTHKSVLIEFQEKSFALAQKTGNWQLVESIQKINAINYIFNSIVHWDDIKEIDDKDKENFLKIIAGIRSNLANQKIRAMKILIDEAQELIAKIDVKLIVHLDFLVDKLDEKINNEFDESADPSEIHQRFGLYESLRDYESIILETDILLNDEKITHPMVLIDLWRSRGLAFRETGQTDEATNAFLTSLAYTYEFPTYGNIIRILLWGQIASTLRNTGSLFDLVFIELLLARLVLPFRLIQAKREKTIGLSETLDKITSNLLEYSTKIDIYDLCNPLVTSMASIKEYKKAGRLADIAMKNVNDNGNVRGEILCNVLKSRLAYEVGDLKSEKKYFDKAIALTQFTTDPMVNAILPARKMKFPDLLKELDDIEKSSKIKP